MSKKSLCCARSRGGRASCFVSDMFCLIINFNRLPLSDGQVPLAALDFCVSAALLKLSMSIEE